MIHYIPSNTIESYNKNYQIKLSFSNSIQNVLIDNKDIHSSFKGFQVLFTDITYNNVQITFLFDEYDELYYYNNKQISTKIYNCLSNKSKIEKRYRFTMPSIKVILNDKDRNYDDFLIKTQMFYYNFGYVEHNLLVLVCLYQLKHLLFYHTMVIHN